MLNRSQVALVSLALALSACDSLAPKPEERSDYAAYVKAVADLRANPPKVFEFECPAEGCKFTKFVAYQTGAGGTEIKPPAPTPRPEHAIVGLFRETKEAVLGLAPFAAPIFLVGAAIKPMRDMAAAFAARPPNTQTTNLNETNNTLTGDGSAIGGSATTSNVANTTNTTTTNTTTTSTTNSNNNSASTTGATSPAGAGK